MKIFNIENGIKKVYVQNNDLIMLNESNISIPCSIYKIINDIRILDDINRFDFIEFSNLNEIEFFEKLDWILDYKKFRNLKEEEILAIGRKIQTNMNNMASNFNNMSIEEKRNNYYLIKRIELLDYKLKSLVDVLLMIQGKKIINFPLVHDYDNFIFTNDKYKITSSLDPNKLLLFKINGEKILNYDEIPNSFIQSAISTILINNKKDTILGDYLINRSISEDNKYLIIEFKINRNIIKKEDKGIKSLIKRIFNRNK